MAEMFFCFFKDATDAFLLHDVVIQLQNVSFCLFSTLAFQLCARSLSFFSMTGGRFYFAHVTVVAEVNDDDDRNTDEKRPESRGAKTVDDESGATGPRKITDRHPEKVARPHAPDRLVVLECGGGRATDRVDQVLDHAHHAQPPDGKGSSVIDEPRSRAESKLQNGGCGEYGTGKRGTAKSHRSHLAADSQRGANAREGADHHGGFATVKQQGDKHKSVVNGDVDVDPWDAD